jgi:hypothetical protein
MSPSPDRDSARQYLATWRSKLLAIGAFGGRNF